ncbi:MAG: glycosyltransferase [Synechococcus sp.]
MHLSILVVSRTANLLNRMLKSLASATNLDGIGVEILCSWNGSQEEELAIENTSGYELLIAQKDRYHFASNMNSLAEKANGELLLIINDDVILDSSSIDNAIRCLESSPKIGLVGARLRDGDGLLTHAGILFDSRHSPYHQLDRKVEAEHHLVLGDSRPIPAVTGALMLIRRNHFASLRFGTSYRVCGEDVGLCLDLRQKLGLEVWYCPGFSALHEAESTRSKTPGQQGNAEDLSTLRQLHREFIEAAKKSQLRQELAASITEADALRSLESNAGIKALKEELKHWRDNSHALHLQRLQLEQELKHDQQVKR